MVVSCLPLSFGPKRSRLGLVGLGIVAAVLHYLLIRLRFVYELVVTAWDVPTSTTGIGLELNESDPVTSATRSWFHSCPISICMPDTCFCEVPSTTTAHVPKPEVLFLTFAVSIKSM